MKKLAIVRQKYNPAGGAERIVSAILQQLRGRPDIDAYLINRKWQPMDGIKGVSVNPFYLGNVWRDRSFARAAKARWQQDGADLVQSHERIPGCHVYRADDGVHRAWLASRRGVKGPLGMLGMMLNPYHHYMLAAEKGMYRSPALKGVICISQMVKHDIIEHYGVAEDKCHVILNGIDTDFFNPQDARAKRDGLRRELGIPPQAPVLVYVGSGFERKGVAQALQAISQQPEVWLVVVGGDKKLRRYQQLAETLGVAGRVRFTGAQSNVRDYYGMADGFILPALYEPFGLVVSEALACGLPVLASSRVGAAELLQPGETGWITPPQDDAGWRAAVAQWLAARERWPQMGVAGRQRVAGMTEKQMVDAMIALYDGLLADHPA
ncbi:glycosyltransferase family 4 protein [Vogesella oryzae]|uniref:glycosyltransferase family 4 protein n=1 Tax=Vogesella oryzae TaxID=1735285 RepID=UPI0015826ED0|nr:glycosyltransferase family 4 protein [Vogesella oryzae]